MQLIVCKPMGNVWEAQMSFFSKALTSLGIGGAKVDAVLDADTYRAGDTVSGELHIEGGGQEHKVDGVTLRLITKYVETEESLPGLSQNLARLIRDHA